MHIDNRILDDFNSRLMGIFAVGILICIFMNVTSSNYTNNVNNNSSISLNTALAQTSYSGKRQVWIDKEDNVKIIFRYKPESLIIGKPTELLFGIQDLHTGDKIKEELPIGVRIANERQIAKITNGNFTDGNFSMNYAFPDSGSYQVISSIESKNVEEVASFHVFVPPQAGSSFSELYDSLILYYVIPVISSTAGIAIYMFYKKKR